MNGDSRRFCFLPTFRQCEVGAPVHQFVDDAYGISFRYDGVGYGYLVLFRLQLGLDI
jgi:hypothetical protein